MTVLLTSLSELLVQHGTWLLFGMAILETCFVTGLVVPSGAATSVATILALGGGLSLPHVFLAALAGGAVGDTVGFWVGHRWGEWLLDRPGPLGRAFRKHRRSAARIFDRHPFYSVTVARLVSFVRTVMPMAAGMSDLRYRVFLPYELMGVVTWAAMYVTIGVVARESWRQVTSLVGAGWVVGFLVLGLVIWARRRIRDAATGTAESGGK